MNREPLYRRCQCPHRGTGEPFGVPGGLPTIGEWLQEWINVKKSLRLATVRSYETHIRLYLTPRIGHITLDRLRVADVVSVFGYIDELNQAVTEAWASGDPAVRGSAKGRRLVGPASCQRIRATLRSAIGSYMRQHPGVLAANVAALVELPPGPRPRALVWTEERILAWRQDFDARFTTAYAAGGRFDPVSIWISVPRPSPVMVWTPQQTAVFLMAARKAPAARFVAADRD
jgi:hypothetical protein